MSAADYPCEECGAQIGEICSPDCPVMQMVWPQGTEAITPPCLEESSAKLLAALRLLPFGSLVGARGEEPPDWVGVDHETWLAQLAEWVEQYQPICSAMVDDLNEQSRRCISLQLEKDMIRNYFKEAFA